MIALAVRGYARSIGRVYAFDLAGAGLGAARGRAAPVARRRADPVRRARRRGRRWPRCCSPGGAAPERRLAGGARGGGRCARCSPRPPRSTPSHRARRRRPGRPGRRALDAAQPRARLPAAGPDARFAARGLRPRLRRGLRYRRGEPLPDWRRARRGPQASATRSPARADALVIGGGGGRDILNALTRAAARGRDRAERGDPRRRGRGPRALLGRALLAAARATRRSATAARRSPSATRSYDQIHIGFTDTFSPNSAQAFALTENNLYTRRGVRGVLRPPEARRRAERLAACDRAVGDEALRATVLDARGAAAGTASRTPSATSSWCSASDILQRASYGTVLAQARALHAGRAAHDRAPGARARRRAWPSRPAARTALEWAELAAAHEPDRLLRGLPASTSARPPTTSPFFFNMKRLGRHRRRRHRRATSASPDPFLVLLITLGDPRGARGAARSCVPLALVPREGRPTARARWASSPPIGLGFLRARGRADPALRAVPRASRPTRSRWCCSRCCCSPAPARSSRRALGASRAERWSARCAWRLRADRGQRRPGCSRCCAR